MGCLVRVYYSVETTVMYMLMRIAESMFIKLKRNYACILQDRVSFRSGFSFSSDMFLFCFFFRCGMLGSGMKMGT